MAKNDNLPEKQNENQGEIRPANRNLMQIMDEFFSKEPYRGVLDSIDSFFRKSPFTQSFPVDFFETTNEWVVQADLPGVKRENINLEGHGDRLKISVATDNAQENRNDVDQYYWRERSMYRTERVIQLPYNISRKNIKASFRNGVLEVRGPKINKQNIIDIE